jgi:putative transposase
VSAFIVEHRERFGVEPICSTLGVSVSAYYERASGRRSARQIEDERLLARIKEVHEANYCASGYRRTWKALLRAGEDVGRDRVRRLMRQNGIQGAKRRGKPWRTTKADPSARRPADLVQRDFAASRPDEKWFADFTYLRCWEGLVFFSFVIDAYSRRIVGWQFAAHMRSTLVLDALRMALHQRQRGADVALIHHGMPEVSTPLMATHRRSTITASWPRSAPSATRWTTPSPSFVDSFKTELIADRTRATRSQLELAVVEYVA